MLPPGLWAGACRIICAASWTWMRCRWRAQAGDPKQACCNTPTGGRAIRVRIVSAVAGGAGHGLQHESHRQLLRQRGDGELLSHAHRGVLQSPTASLGDRLQESRSVRGQPELRNPSRPRSWGRSIVYLKGSTYFRLLFSLEAGALSRSHATGLTSPDNRVAPDYPTRCPERESAVWGPTLLLGCWP